MRTIYILIFAFLVFGFSIVEKYPTECKKWGGVYLSSNSYLQKQLSDSVCVADKRVCVYEGTLNKIVIKTGKEKRIFNPGEIFAYSDGENIYRYFQTSETMSPYGYFKIEDTSGLIIYSQKHFSYRHSSTGYYYSESINGLIKILNIKNLETDFANLTFVAEVKSLVESLKNKSTEKAMVSIREINAIFKKHNR
jgi:hypothetical protein